MGPFPRFLVALLVVLIPSVPFAQAQSGRWVQHPSVSPVGSSYKHAIGTSLILYAADSSNVVRVFDLQRHTWVDHLVPTRLPWRGSASAGSTVAMVWNDSLLAAYSSISGTLGWTVHPRPLFNNWPEGYGSAHDMAWFVSDNTFWVFDGTDATWRAHAYTPPSGATSVWVVAEKDYLLLRVVGPFGSGENSYVAYSHEQRAFLDIPGRDVEYTSLDGGFLSYPTTIGLSSYTVSGYSARTGTIATTSVQGRPGPLVKQKDAVTRWVSTAMLTYSEPITGGYRVHAIGFDARRGAFRRVSFDFTDPNVGGEVRGYGGEFGVFAVRDHGNGDVVDHWVYSGRTGDFTSYRTPLDYHGTYDLPHVSAGGSVYLGYGRRRALGYDLAGVRYAWDTIPLHPFDPFPPFASRAFGDRWLAFGLRPASDSLWLYSYSGETNVFPVMIRRAPGSDAFTAGRNTFAHMVQTAGIASRLYVYSAIRNQWWEFDCGNQQYAALQAFSSYAELRLPGGNRSVIYDAATGQQFVLPMVPSPFENYGIWDSSYVIWTHTGRVMGYSPSAHGWSEIQTNILTARQGTGAIQCFGRYGGANNWVLTYNGLRNSFVELTLTPAQGNQLVRTGSATALLVTTTGYLFAFDPDLPTEVQPGGTAELPREPVLSQNYPNPFNPSTEVEFVLPRRGRAVLEVFDILGRQVRTLLDETRDAGTHAVQFEAAGFPSGVYFCRLTAGGVVRTTKMMLLR